MATKRSGAHPNLARDVHVVPHYSGWATKREGGVRVSRLADTQEDAIAYGRRMAQRDKVDLVIYGKDGAIQGSVRYGNDRADGPGASKPPSPAK